MGLCYVTGASGFLGQAACLALSEGGHSVIALSRTGTKLPGCDNVRVLDYEGVIAEQDSLCVHTAESNVIAEVGAQQRSSQVAVMSALLSQPFKRIIYASSAAVYPSSLEDCHQEDEDLQSSEPQSIYQQTKLEIEGMLRADQARQHIILRFAGIYGQGMSRAAVLPTILSQLQSSSEVRVRCLSPRRDYIYIADAAAAIVNAANAGPGGVYNIGSGKSISVRELIEVAAEVRGQAVPAIFESQPTSKPSCIKLNISKANNLLHWQPRYTLQQGLRACLNGAL